MKKIILVLLILTGCKESVLLSKPDDSVPVEEIPINPNEAVKSFAGEGGGYATNGQYQLFFKLDSAEAKVDSPNGYQLILIEE